MVIDVAHASEIKDADGFPLVGAIHHNQVTSIFHLALLIADADSTVTNEKGVQWHLPNLCPASIGLVLFQGGFFIQPEVAKKLPHYFVYGIPSFVLYIGHFFILNGQPIWK